MKVECTQYPIQWRPLTAHQASAVLLVVAYHLLEQKEKLPFPVGSSWILF